MSKKKNKKGSEEKAIVIQEPVIDVYEQVYVEAQRMLANAKRPQRR